MLLAVACQEDIPQEITPPTSEGRLSLEVTSQSDLLRMNESGSAGEVLFRSKGGELFVDVVTNMEQWEWSAEDAEWLTIEADDYGLRIEAEENNSSENLSATILIRTHRSNQNAIVELSVKQNHSGMPEIEAARESVRVKALSELSHSIEIITNQDEWDFDCTCSWLLLEKKDNLLIITADKNLKEAQREVEITLTAQAGESVATDVLRVSQDGSAYLRLASLNITADDQGAHKIVEVISNPELDWTFAVEENDWFSAERVEEHLEVEILPNMAGLERFGSLTITVGESDNNTSATLKIHQIGTDTDELIYEIEVTQVPYTHIAAPVLNDGSICVDWGDGSESETFEAKRGSHTYNTPGKYTLSITGNASSLEFSDGESYAPEILNIISWGQLGVVNAADMCLGCNNLESIPNDVAGSFSNVKSFIGAFSCCDSLKEIPAGLFRHATLAKNFEDCFSHTGSIQEIPEELFANCTAAQRFAYTFYGTGTGTVVTNQTLSNLEEVRAMVEVGKLKTIPEGLFRNCPEAQRFDYVFGATAISEIPEGIFANNAKATIFTGAFSACTNLTTIPQGFMKGATGATDIKYMFAGCQSLTEIPVGMFSQNTAVTNLEYIFYRTGVRQLSKGIFEGLTSVKTIGAVFQDCIQLEEIQEGVFDGLTAAKSFKYCFSGCSSLRTIPSGLFRGLTAAYDFKSTFEDSALESIPADLFNDARDYSSADFSYMLAGCKNLKTVPAALFERFTTVTSPGFKYCFAKSGIESIPAGLFQKNVKVSTGFENTFYLCESLTEIEGPIFPTSSNVSSLAYTFAGCTSLEELPEGLFDAIAESKTKFSATFFACTSLKRLPSKLFALNTLATQFPNAFNSCTALEEIPSDLLGSKPNVKSVQSMFENCSSLKTLPEGLFAGSPAITSFEATFALCSGLESVPADLFSAIGTTTSSVTFSECFLDCTSLQSLPVTLFDTVRRINYIDLCFSGCSSLSGESPYTIVTNAEGEEVKIHLYERTRGDDFPNAPVSATAHEKCFAGCTNLADYNSIPADWK